MKSPALPWARLARDDLAALAVLPEDGHVFLARDRHIVEFAVFSRRLHLRPGVDPAHAARIIQDLISSAVNVSGQSGGATPVARITMLRNAYLSWAENAEAQLDGLTLDPAVPEALRTPGAWRIRSLHDDPQPFPLVDRELGQHKAFLQALADDLQERLDRMSRAPGRLVVLDTNVLLHFQTPENVAWDEVIGQRELRLVVPLRVVEELDEKKYARRDDLAQRARTVLAQLRSHVSDAGRPGKLRVHTTIEVPVEPRGRVRPLDADQEILLELMTFSKSPLVLVTGDTAMQLRAEALGIGVVEMPARYARAMRS